MLNVNAAIMLQATEKEYLDALITEMTVTAKDSDQLRGSAKGKVNVAKKCFGCKKKLDFIDCAAVRKSYVIDKKGLKSKIKIQLICPDCLYEPTELNKKESE